MGIEVLGEFSLIEKKKKKLFIINLNFFFDNWLYFGKKKIKFEWIVYDLHYFFEDRIWPNSSLKPTGILISFKILLK